MPVSFGPTTALGAGTARAKSSGGDGAELVKDKGEKLKSRGPRAEWARRSSGSEGVGSPAWAEIKAKARRHKEESGGLLPWGSSVDDAFSPPRFHTFLPSPTVPRPNSASSPQSSAPHPLTPQPPKRPQSSGATRHGTSETPGSSTEGSNNANGAKGQGSDGPGDVSIESLGTEGPATERTPSSAPLRLVYQDDDAELSVKGVASPFKPPPLKLTALKPKEFTPDKAFTPKVEDRPRPVSLGPAAFTPDAPHFRAAHPSTLSAEGDKALEGLYMLSPRTHPFRYDTVGRPISQEPPLKSPRGDGLRDLAGSGLKNEGVDVPRGSHKSPRSEGLANELLWSSGPDGLKNVYKSPRREGYAIDGLRSSGALNFGGFSSLGGKSPRTEASEMHKSPRTAEDLKGFMAERTGRMTDMSRTEGLASPRYEETQTLVQTLSEAQAPESLPIDPDRVRMAMSEGNPVPSHYKASRMVGGKHTATVEGQVTTTRGSQFKMHAVDSGSDKISPRSPRIEKPCARCAHLSSELKTLQSEYEKVQSKNQTLIEEKAKALRPAPILPPAPSPRRTSSNATPKRTPSKSSPKTPEPKAEVSLSTLLKLQTDRDHYKELYEELKEQIRSDMEAKDFADQTSRSQALLIAEIKESMKTEFTQTLEHERYEKERLRMKTKQTQTQIEKLERALSNASDNLQKAERQHNQELQDVLKALRQHELNTEIERSQSAEAIFRASSLEAASESHSSEVAGLEKELQESKKKCVDLKEQYLARKLEVDNLLIQKEELMEKIQRGLNEKAELQNRLQEAQTFMQKYTVNQRKMENQMKSMEKELKEAQTAVSVEQQRGDALFENFDKKQDELQEKLDDEKTLQQRLKQELEVSMSRANNLQFELEHFREHNDMLHQHKIDSENAYNSLLMEVGGVTPGR